MYHFIWISISPVHAFIISNCQVTTIQSGEIAGSKEVEPIWFNKVFTLECQFNTNPPTINRGRRPYCGKLNGPTNKASKNNRMLA